MALKERVCPGPRQTGNHRLFCCSTPNVYISRAAGRLPAPLREVMDQALLFHRSVALAELAVGIANADPSRQNIPRSFRDHYIALFAAIPATRLITPDAPLWADAGVIAGIGGVQEIDPAKN
jgi:hypothetical protein